MQFSEDAVKRLITAIGYTPQDFRPKTGKVEFILKAIKSMMDIVFLWILTISKLFTIPMKIH